MTIKVLGDTALLVELAAGVGEEPFDRVQFAAQLIRAAAWPEVLEVVPARTALAVHLRRTARWAVVARQVSALLESRLATESTCPAVAGPVQEIAVCYGAACGPDLAEVAKITGLSPEAVVALHAEPTYRVEVIGFAPGFPYLRGLPESLRCPRRRTPRTRVQPGSVGIGGGQTGIYPQALPGGWNLIGRTAEPLFDPWAASPCRLQPGATVRFRPVAEAEFAAAWQQRQQSAPLHRSKPGVTAGAGVEVVQAGLQTTVQDAGRNGAQAWGVTEGGAVDRRALRLANLMVGNPADAAVLEWAIQGPRLRFQDRRVVATAGAIAAGVPFGRPFVVAAGEELDMSRVPVGCRGVLAISGGVDVAPVLGSRGTHLLAGFGGWEGRALKAGDVLPLGTARTQDLRAGWMVSPALSQPVTGETPEVRILRGPEGDAFAGPMWGALLSDVYRARSQSDRMGLRLMGTPLSPRAPLEIVSQPVAAGTIQVPADGQPIVLLADRQSLGGYPRIANVISVDLPVLAQIPPGGSVRFVETTLAEAEALRLAEERDFGLFHTALQGRLIPA